MDNRHEVKADIWRLEQKLKSMKEDHTQLEFKKKELEASGLSITPTATSRVSGKKSQGAADEPGAPKKKKKNKQKRHPGLPPQQGQEYYKSYLVHL